MRADKAARGTSWGLESLLTEFSLFVKELCPEATMEITETAYEDEDANIFVWPPISWTAEDCDALEERLSARSIDILLQTGYHILVGVFETALKK